MTRLVLFCTIALFAVAFTSAVSFKEVIVIDRNITNGEIIEEVTFDGSKSKPKVAHIKFVTVPKTSSTTRPGGNKKKHHRHHMRRRCCEAGDLAGKHGLSCDISHNFSLFFLNKTTLMRLKFQSTPDKGSIRRRFLSARIYRIYRRINKCVKQHMKGAVEKCCLAYIAKQRTWAQG